jgi:phospholipase C
MQRTPLFCLWIQLLLAVSLLLSIDGCAGFSSGGTAAAVSNQIPQGKFQHIVIIFQENRTPDNLFHDPVLIANGADIASSGLNSSGEVVPLTPTPLGINYDLNHAHSSFVAMYDGGKMDGADQIPIACSVTVNCPPPNAQYMYVQASDVEPYFQLAEQYTFGDRMFQTNQGPSFPAHQFIISGTSAPTAASKWFAAENPGGGNAGCAGGPGAYVDLIDASGEEASWTYPCFEHPTLTDELNQEGLSWRYYTPDDGGYYASLWTAPNAIQHMCVPNAPPPNATECTGPDWVNNVIPYTPENPAPILTDIMNGQLAAVSWVIPSVQNSDHAGHSVFTGGPSWVSAIVNAIGNSSYWANTAIIITWDDWGGWYDHVPPSRVINDRRDWGSGYVYGFRVPLIVVAPYAKAGYISHVNHDFGSILSFVEQNFGLATLGYADARADNLADCFNFNQTPLPFQMIQAPLDARHFLNDRSIPVGPDDD